MKMLPFMPPEGPQQPIEVRTRALGALSSVAKAIPNQRSMWQDKKLVKLLLEVTCVDQEMSKKLKLANKPPKEPDFAIKATVYLEAMRVIVAISQLEENQEEMARYPVPDILDAAAQDRALSFRDRRDFGNARKQLLGEERT